MIPKPISSGVFKSMSATALSAQRWSNMKSTEPCLFVSYATQAHLTEKTSPKAAKNNNIEKTDEYEKFIDKYLPITNDYRVMHRHGNNGLHVHFRGKRIRGIRMLHIRRGTTSISMGIQKLGRQPGLRSDLRGLSRSVGSLQFLRGNFLQITS